jgi:hypothetical protein
MKTIIFGVSGTVGKALTRTLTGNNHDIYGSYHLRKPSFLPNDRVIQLPVGELDSLDKLLTQVNPDFVIMVLRGDFEKQLKFHVNIAEHLRNDTPRTNELRQQLNERMPHKHLYEFVFHEEYRSLIIETDCLFNGAKAIWHFPPRHYRYHGPF